MKHLALALVLIVFTACKDDGDEPIDGGDGGAVDGAVDGASAAEGCGPFIAPGGPDTSIVAHDIAIDADGNVYVVGLFAGAFDFGGETVSSCADRDAFLASYTAACALRWVRAIGQASPIPADDVIAAVTVGPDGNVYVAGHFAVTLTIEGDTLTAAGNLGQDVFVASFDAGGAYRWSSRYDYDAADADQQPESDYAEDIDADADRVVVVGVANPAGVSGLFAVSLDVADGAEQWRFEAGAEIGFAAARGQGVAIDDAGRTYVVGSGAGDLGLGALPSPEYGYAAALIRLDTGGVPDLAQLYGVSDPDYQGFVANSANAIEIAPDGSVLVAGELNHEIAFAGGTLQIEDYEADVFLARLTPGGAFVAGAAFGGEGRHMGLDVAVAASGAAHVAGYYHDAMSFAGEALPSPFADSIFAARVDEALAPRWLKGFESFGNISGGSPMGIAAAPDGALYFAGVYGGAFGRADGEPLPPGTAEHPANLVIYRVAP